MAVVGCGRWFLAARARVVVAGNQRHAGTAQFRQPVLQHRYNDPPQFTVVSGVVAEGENSPPHIIGCRTILFLSENFRPKMQNLGLKF